MSRGPLSVDELRAYCSKLLALEDRLTGRVANLEAEALRPADPNATTDESPAHEADRQVRESEEAVARTLLGSEEAVLNETRAALARIQAHTFGNCERCGGLIPRVRLDAVPYARHCVRCAAAPVNV